MAICLASGLTLLPAAHAVVSDGNPYKAIITRNPFGLIPPPPPAPVTTVTPPSNIQLTGITTLMGKKLAMLMATEPGPGKTPQSYMLTENQRDGQIEVLEIDDKTGTVKINNAGVNQTLTFDKDGIKAAASPIPGLPGGMPPPGGVGIPMPARPGNPPTLGGGLRQIPTARDVRTPSTPAAQPTATATAASANSAAKPTQPPMTPEVQTTMIEVNRELTREQVKNKELPPLPPTDLTSDEDLQEITAPAPPH